ncbi:MAG: chemotaxis protein CheW, partial [Myxococcales bacterium]
TRLLVLEHAGARLAVRLEEVAGVHTDRRIVPVPGMRWPLLGLVAIRGELLPAFDFGAVTGAGRAAAAPRWLAVVRGERDARVALGFDRLELAADVPNGAIRRREGAEEDAVVRAIVRIGEQTLPLLSLGPATRRLAGAGDAGESR